MKRKEVAKFFCGVAASQALTHGALALSGGEFKIFGVLYDRSLNSTAVVVWAVVLNLLIYYAWIRHERS